MDHRSAELMEDLVLEGKSVPRDDAIYAKGIVACKPPKEKFGKSIGGSAFSMGKLKVEMQTLRISEESEKQLYNTLKHIYGSDFRLSDPSEFEDKRSNLGKQYWMERGNLVVKGIVNYSSNDNTQKSQERIARQFAINKLESYSFHSSHCEEALMHTKGDMGKALEVLFDKYYIVKSNFEPEGVTKELNIQESLERREEEKEALQSIYGDAFIEKIKNQIWIVKLKLDYLTNEKNGIEEKSKEAKKERDICRLYLHRKCRFGSKCRFLHQQPSSQQRASAKALLEDNDPYFSLEIRFPEGCKYPYEAPYIYFYKNDGTYPKINCLRIGRRLHNEALLLSVDGTPSVFSIISLLESECDIRAYLVENRERFLDQNESLFAELTENEDMGKHLTAVRYERGSTNKYNGSDVSLEEIMKENDLIRKRFMEKRTDRTYRRMEEHRARLPAWSMMYDILRTIRDNQVSVVSGETGCGKSTQVPQFLLDEWIVQTTNDRSSYINIVCTQPRRISAISVAERVAAERNESVGNTVGYQIRLKSKTSRTTRLTFCTTGILLQRFTDDRHLSRVTHVIVDEVHERSAESDFLLMLLKRILPKRPDLKVILMSATLKADVFSSYFGETPVLCIPGKTFPVEQIFLEDIFEMTDYVLEENSKYTRKFKGGWDQLQIDLETMDVDTQSGAIPNESVLDENLSLAQMIVRYFGRSKRTYKNLYVMDHEKINYDLIETIVEWIVFGEHGHPSTGSILIFLPGFAEIVTLKDQLTSSKKFSSKNKEFLVLPLHSALSSEEESLVFKRPEGDSTVRKIILSTNIAETSITIDDCVFVIDTGKMKETRFNANQNMESLETCWVSRTNAMQRKGRAGRVMPGVCIHLYTSYRFRYHLAAQPVPEILRIPLESLILRIQLIDKATKVDVRTTLGNLLKPPSDDSISSAITRLQDVGALNHERVLTPLGHHLAALPVNVRIGKLILFGAIFRCLDSALTVAAYLSSQKSLFNVPFEKRHTINTTKEFVTANSDQLTILRAYKKWLDCCVRSSYAGQVFANENYLSVRTLHALADIKHQFLELLVSIGFVPVNVPKRRMGQDRILEITGSELNANNENYKLLQGLLCAALYPNVVKVLTPAKSFQVQSTGAIPIQPKAEELRFQMKHDGFVNIHPSSVNFSTSYFSSPYLVFQERTKTSRVYIKGVSMVPILPLILFSSYELNVELHDGTFILSLDDGWIVFTVESVRVGQLIQRMRIELANLLRQKMEDPFLNLLNHPQGKKIISTIVSVVTIE